MLREIAIALVVSGLILDASTRVANIGKSTVGGRAWKSLMRSTLAVRVVIMQGPSPCEGIGAKVKTLALVIGQCLMLLTLLMGLRYYR